MNGMWTAAAGNEFGAAWLEQEIAPAGDFGRRAREGERRYGPGDEAAARAAIARVHRVACEVAPEMLAALHGAIAACPDLASALARARAGAVLADTDFFEISRFLDAVAAALALATHCEFRALGLPARDEALVAALAAGRTAERTFYLGDDFDAELKAVRGAAAALRARYDAERSRLAERVAAYAGLDHVRDGEFVLMRERAATPLPREIRVLREAPTYYLCELTLDGPALEALAHLDASEARVAEREEAVRARLSAAVHGAASGLDAAAAKLGVLDSFVTRARFAQRYDACLPQIPDEPALAFDEARFLPLAASLAARGHRYVPLSIDLDGVGVLTGPNMGGKTAALQTCGFVAACVALGLPVPAAAARVALFDEVVWIGAGGEGANDALLSSFGREVTQVRDFLARARSRPLALVDEFARTTTPREGGALLVALLERLRDRGAVGLAATHLSRIAEDAGVAHFAVVGLRELPERAEGTLDLDVAIERIARVMDYRVRRVGADDELRADAIALADVLGLDAALIARARSAL
jgi:DNA mismatch repair protein MutS2